MISFFKDLYDQFLIEGKMPVSAGMTEREFVEENYWKAKKQWEQCKAMLKKVVFENDAEEIEFFKKVKPYITCQVEYYVLLSEALLFVPGNRPTDTKELVISFWAEQEKRCQRFFDKHKILIEYYESGDTVLDDEYFLRRNNSIDVSTVSPAPVHEESNEYCTYADPLIRGYLAYKKYNAYVRNQLMELRASETT